MANKNGDTATADTLRTHNRSLARDSDAFLREPLTSSMARGAGSAPAVDNSVAPAVSNAAPCECRASQFVRHRFTSPSEKLP